MKETEERGARSEGRESPDLWWCDLQSSILAPPLVSTIGVCAEFLVVLQKTAVSYQW